MISDLNSNIPVSIAPGNIQAIVNGDGKNAGEIKYIKGNYLNDIEDKSIVYTSGTGSIFKSGIPVGRIEILENQDLKTFKVNFYSSFVQLKYVFAELYSKREEIIKEKIKNTETVELKTDNQNQYLTTTDRLKLNLLNEQIEIYTNTNLKLLNENKKLESKINNLNSQLVNLQNKITSQNKVINQNKVDTKELEFLKLNLIYSKKCKKNFTNPKGFKFGTKEYRDCVINKGKIQ